MKITILVCRILFLVAAVGFMNESAYSQKLKKKEEAKALPIPQDQKDFIKKIQVAMINKQLATYTENPVARKEAVSKASTELTKEIDKFSEIIKKDGLNDWIAVCSLNAEELDLQIEILAENPKPPLGFNDGNVRGIGNSINTPLSTKFSIRFSLTNQKNKVEQDVLDSIKKLKQIGFVKFTLEKYPIEIFSGNTFIRPPSSVLKAISPLK